MNKFNIIKELGGQKKRKFSSVFLVSRNSDQEKFVLKEVKKNENTTLQQEKIKQEAQFLGDELFLQKTIDFWEDNQSIFLLKEYVVGEPLDSWWNNQNTPKLERLKFLLSGLSPIFNYLKTHKIAHNDIKPSNILVTTNNGTTEFVLIDFGLAFHYPTNHNSSILFALGFAAPEVVLSKNNCVNHSSDLFSLGILILYIWTGKLPLSHPNPTVFTNLQITYPIKDSGNIPTDVFRIISKMCQKHPFRLPPNQLPEKEVSNGLLEAQNLRYQSINEIMDDLNKIKIKSWWNFLIKIFSKSN